MKKREAGDQTVIAAAEELLEKVRRVDPPEFVQDRLGKLATLIAMAKDERWAIPRNVRTRVLDALQSWSVEPLRRKLNGEQCASCAIRGCGGCRALSFALEGDPYGDDPQCVLSADRRR